MKNGITVPLSDLLRNFFATRPKDVDGVGNSSALYYQDKLFRQLLGRFELTGAPDGWDLDYTMEHLFLDGYFAITDTDVGVIPLRCGYAGLNVFDKPTDIIISNHLLGELRRTIGVDGALVKLQYNYRGIGRILQRYAALLAMCDSSLSVNLINAKVAFIAFAETKAQAETMKKMYDALSCGEPAVFLRGAPEGVRDSFLFNNVKQNFVGGDIQDLKNRITDEFLTEIGIKNTNTEKKERLVTYEAESRDEETNCGVAHWITTVNKGLRVANRLYDMNLKFGIRELESPQEDGKEGVEDELSKPD